MVIAKFARFYLQREVLYTHFKNEYKEVGESIDVKKDRIDIPINVGKTFALGLVQVQTGPVFSFNISDRSEEHTSELQSRGHLVCRLLLEKKNNIPIVY